MSALENREILRLVADSGLPRRRALVQLGLPKSTYYLENNVIIRYIYGYILDDLIDST